jgi:hypothetical protein
MARRILNRKDLREEADVAQRAEAEGIAPKEGGNAEASPKKAAKKTPRGKSRAKVAKEVRLKAFWGVFSQALAQVAQYEYGQREEADKKAKELSDSRKTPHFVQLVKRVIEE